MKNNISVDWSIKKNIKYLLMLFVLCGVIPHVMLSMLQIASESDNWSPAEIESYSNLFVCQWIPFWLTFISYLRLQKMDNFSWIPSICSAVIVLTYLPRFEQNSVMTITLAIPLAFVVELSGLLRKVELSKSKIVSAIATDRGILRAFYYWSVVFLCVVLISCKACTFERTIVSPFQMLPIPGVLLFEVFRHQKKQPPTLWSVIGMLVAIPLSLFLVTVGPLAQFKIYHLMSLGVGYAFLLILLAVYNLDRWKKPA